MSLEYGIDSLPGSCQYYVRTSVHVPKYDVCACVCVRATFVRVAQLLHISPVLAIVGVDTADIMYTSDGKVRQ
jgi:hypothetical protein